MHETRSEIIRAVDRIYREAIDPLADSFAFERRPSEGEVSGPPTVLIVGNHSSGKSTFINYLLGFSTLHRDPKAISVDYLLNPHTDG